MRCIVRFLALGAGGVDAVPESCLARDANVFPLSLCLVCVRRPPPPAAAPREAPLCYTGARVTSGGPQRNATSLDLPAHFCPRPCPCFSSLCPALTERAEKSGRIPKATCLSSCPLMLPYSYKGLYKIGHTSCQFQNIG